jgi:hypothetical protein
MADSEAGTAFDRAVAALAVAEADFYRTRSADARDGALAAAERALQVADLPPGAAVGLLNLGARLTGLYDAAHDAAFLTMLAQCVDRIEPVRGQLPAAALPNYLAQRGDARFKLWRTRHAGYLDAEIRGMPLLEDAVASLTEGREAMLAADPLTGRTRPLYLNIVATLAAAARAQRKLFKVRPDLGPYAGLLRQVLDEGGGDPASRAQCAWTLGRILWDEYAEAGSPLVLLEAVSRLGSAVEQAPAADADRLAYQLAYATAAAWLAREAGQVAGDTAAADLPGLWARGLQANPGAVHDSARLWAELQAREGNWAASADAYAAAASATLTALRRRATEEERRLLLRGNRGFFVHAAFALAKAGRLAQAVVTLERGRGVFFAKPPPDGSPAAGDLADMAVVGDPARDGAPAAEAAAAEAAAAEALVRLGEGHAVAFVLVTWYGGAAIVLRQGQPPWLVDLPELTADEAERRLARLIAAYLASYPPPNTVISVSTADGPEETRRWEPELDAVAGWSWGAVMGPLLGSLPGCQELTLIPVGTLPALPLHAAWTAAAPPVAGPTEPAVAAEPGAPAAVTGRTYALDLLAVSYAPTLRACLTARGRWAGFADGLVLGIDDPGAVGVPALRGARLEAEVLAELFDDVLVLRGADATAAAVKSALPRASLVHFGCHGGADLLKPGNSRLLLHGTDTLTLAEIGQLDLSRARVCVLSACESATMGTELPDEVISLPTAFAQAGAGTVAGSLWAVPDQSTALLVRKFYRNLKGGDSPAQALRQAQRWLRDSTWAEQAAELPPGQRPGGDALARSPLGQQRLTQAIADWAAFVVTD